MTSILSDLVPEPPPTCRETAVSKIPLPKCLVESPVRTARSRTELRDINLAGVGCKWDQENNSVNFPLYSNSEPSTLFTTSARFIRGHGDSAAQAGALTPISVNTFSAIIDGAGSNATTRHDSPPSQQSPFVSGSSSSRFILCRHGPGEMLSPEELPSLICERGKHVESMRLSTSGILAGDSTFVKISSNGSAFLESNADHSAMNSCHSSEELLRTSSILMELEDAPLGSSDTESADQRSTKKDLFDASLLAEEDSDLVTFDKTMTTSLFAHGELHSPFEDENLFIVHNCREDHQRQAACFPLHALEEQLEDDIQRDIEGEISKEIQHLSQKLANLQARHGAQRTSDGSGMPSVLSCPVTPVLTPRISRLRKEQANYVGSSKPEVDHGGRHKRGRLVAARVSSGREKPAHQLSRGAVRKESSLERRCSSSNSLNARCAPSGQQEEHCGEDSPSSGSIRSHATDSTHNKKPRARKLLAGVPSPQVFPDSNRRFEWVKTLRSGETGNIRHSKQIPSISGEELESKVSLESVKKQRVALLADMTRELETRLNELAVESAAHPARNVGRVVASRYNQPRREKRQPEDYYGSLQKRTAAHLMKAGLTRRLAGKKSPESCSKSRPEKKAGEKVPEKKSVGIQHDPSCDQPSHDLEQTFKTAYEEGPTGDGPKIISEALDVKKHLHEEQADQGKISPGNSSEEQPSAVSRPRLNKRQPIKRTYIRCIEVVNDPSLADRSASGAIENLSTSRIISESTEGEGCLSPKATSNSNPHVTDTSQLSVISLHDKVIGSKSVKPRDRPLRSTVFKIHGKLRQELGCVQADMIPGSSDLKVLAAEKPPLSSLRESWDELIDGLEKERLTLPNIRTETGSAVTSPRDSGGVKRITEQRLRSKEQHFNPENFQEDEKLSVNVIKETSQKSKPTRRSLRRNHEEFNIPKSDLEGFDLQSFWCLVRESEDHVPTTTTTAHPPIAAVR